MSLFPSSHQKAGSWVTHKCPKVNSDITKQSSKWKRKVSSIHSKRSTYSKENGI